MQVGSWQFLFVVKSVENGGKMNAVCRISKKIAHKKGVLEHCPFWW